MEERLAVNTIVNSFKLQIPLTMVHSIEDFAMIDNNLIIVPCVQFQLKEGNWHGLILANFLNADTGEVVNRYLIRRRKLRLDFAKKRMLTHFKKTPLAIEISAEIIEQIELEESEAKPALQLRAQQLVARAANNEVIRLFELAKENIKAEEVKAHETKLSEAESDAQRKVIEETKIGNCGSNKFWNS